LPSYWGEKLQGEYRRQAAECVRLAEQAEDLATKLTYVGLARAWIGLADLADKSDHTDIVSETPA
jgi:hypothetical protein